MNTRGVHLPDDVKYKAFAHDDGPGPAPQVIMPDITIIHYKAKNKLGDAETQNLHITDIHYGEITPSYNIDIANARLKELFESLLTITTLHRKMYPINVLKIHLTGDMVHGENPHQGAKVESIEKGAQTQVTKYAFPSLLSFALSCKQEFAEVELECVPGNHGRISREAPETSNWDLMLYTLLKTALEPHKVKVNISETWYRLVDIQGHRFFLFHADQVRMSNGIPYFALIRKIQSWQIHFGGFEYAECGHFHKEDYLRVNAHCKLIMGSSLATDDQWALKVIGTSSIPVMWTYGVHKERGVTWMYSLNTDKNFLPNYFSGNTDIDGKITK